MEGLADTWQQQGADLATVQTELRNLTQSRHLAYLGVDSAHAAYLLCTIHVHTHTHTHTHRGRERERESSAQYICNVRV